MTDEEFLQRFEDCSLPFNQWTHRAHVKVAFLYLRSHDFDDALKKVRSGIRKYNAAHSVPEGPHSGYNETTTVAFLHLVYAMVATYQDTFPATDAESFCDIHPQLLSKHILRLFYSPERRSHPDAKYCFIEPDLASLPQIRS